LIFFIISISLLNFSFIMLTFLSRSWIYFLTSLICLFETSLRSLIIINKRLLNSLNGISTNSLSSVSHVELWELGGQMLPWFFIFKLLHCVLLICCSNIPFTSLVEWRTYCKSKVNNSAINQVFQCERNIWSPVSPVRFYGNKILISREIIWELNTSWRV
jgi:hypothetical protein